MKTYKTRDGREARVYATDGTGSYPVHGAISAPDGWGLTCWTRHGAFDRAGESDLDLIDFPGEARKLPDPYAELKAAHAAGKVIQFRHPTGGAWTDGCSFEWVLPPDFYRVKPDPQPLGPEDVPSGSVILWNATPGNFASTPHEWSSVLGVIPEGVYTVGFYVGSPDEPTIDFTSFKDLVLHQIKRPGEDWKPCYK